MLSRPLHRKRQKLSDVIVESVKRSIVTDALKPGDRLPTERELMESFQCSKGSAREALKALEVEGLVNTRTGPSGGAYLNQAGTEPASCSTCCEVFFQRSKPRSNCATSCSASSPGCIAAYLCTRS